MKIKKIVILLILVIVITSILSGCMYFMPTDSSVYVPPLQISEKIVLPTANVIVGDLRIVYNKEAIIVPDVLKTEIIECDILGKLDEVYVKNGEQVTKGQLVAILDVETINEQIYKQEIAVEKATMSYERQLALYNSGKVDWYALEISRLSLESLTNYLNDLYEKHEQHYIYASISGIVVEVYKFEGSSAKGDILSICPKENFIVQYEIPQTDNDLPTVDTILLGLKSGKDNGEINLVVIYDGQQHDGYVFRTSYEYSLAYDYFGETTYGQIAFNGNIDNLVIGKNATIRYIENEVLDAKVIPVSAVYEGNNDTYYTHVVVNNEREYRPIIIGMSDGVFYEVIEGLSEGEKILKSR